LWSPLRGFARSTDRYYALLAAADEPRRGDLDGRGNLSQQALVDWIGYVLSVCQDQVDFMAALLKLGDMERRIAACLAYEEQTLRSGVRLAALRPLLDNAEWEELASARRSRLSTVSLRSALEAAASELEGARSEEARTLTTAFCEYLAQTDYGTYFDSRVTPTGAQAAEFAAFGLKAESAAAEKLSQFLALFSAEDVEAARTAISSSSAFAD
jgi:hypothetical protein